MDNPWASAWDNPPDKNWPPQEADIAWPADTTPQWPTTTGAVWLQSDAPSPTVQSQDMVTESELDNTTAHDQPGISHLSSLSVSEPSPATGTFVSDYQVARSTSPPQGSFCPVPETSDATPHNIASVARASDEENLKAAINLPDDDWGVAWSTHSEADPKETQSPDQWEVARQEKEKLNRTVPPELLDSLLRHCQQVSQEIWPASDTSNQDNWSSGFDDLADIAALLAQLLPADSTLPPTVQFSATATAKAMNEALKLTRHLPASASSPLSRLLASKGSLEWEKSIRAKQAIVPDTAHVGWRVLEKEDRSLSTIEESKPRKVSGGLLSFWNRRASAIQVAPVDTPSEPSRSPARSSLDNVPFAPHPPSSQVASPSTPSVPPPPPPESHSTMVATASGSSAVSRFLNRFSRSKGAQHNSLALSSDDLEFLSDIVPSASDPPDDDGTLGALTGVSNSSPLPPKLPPPIPSPPKQPILSIRPSSALGLGTLGGVSVVGSAPTAFQMQGANHTPIVPVLIPPLSPKSAASFSHPQNPHLSRKDATTPTIASGQSSAPSIPQRFQPSSQPNSQPYSSFIVPPPQDVIPSLSIPPLLPPPPISPPQTPRPSAFPPIITPGHSSTMRSIDISPFHDSDDEFTAFTSFPSSAFSSSDSYPSARSPSPPSPPPRRTYERTHYPSSSSTSSMLSPASQASVDQLYSTRSSVSASLGGFDDFVSSPSAVRGENRKRTPSPPPLPIKPQSQHRQPSRIDTLPSRAYHAHTPSQTFTSPTVHTSLMNGAFSAPSVSDAEHRRTQGLVNHAAARGGLLWPNSPGSDEPKMMVIPPPLPSSTSPKSLFGEEAFDLLDDGNTLGGGLEVLPSPLSVAGGTGMDSTMSSPTTAPLRAPFGVAGGPGKGLGSRNPLQPSPPPLRSISTPILAFSSLGTPFPATTTNTGSLQPAKPKQTGGLSAQDLSFFEGL